MKNQHDLIHSLLHSLPFGILLIDSDCRILFSNNQVQNILGNRDELRSGQSFLDLFSKRESSLFASCLKHADQFGHYPSLLNIKNRSAPVPADISSFNQGSEHGYLITVKCEPGVSKGSGAFTREPDDPVTRNVLMMIGNLVGGIAHNINNLLTVILSRAQLIEIKHPLITDAHIIAEESKMLNNIIDCIYSKKQYEKEDEIKSVNLNRLLKIELKFLEADSYFKHNIRAETEFHPSLPLIRGVYRDFSQGFLGIIRFLIESLIESGKEILRISTSDTRESISVTFEAQGYEVKNPSLINMIETDLSRRYGSSGSNKHCHEILTLDLYRSVTLLMKNQAKIEITCKPKHGTAVKVTFPVEKMECCS